MERVLGSFLWVLECALLRAYFNTQRALFAVSYEAVKRVRFWLTGATEKVEVCEPEEAARILKECGRD